MSITLGTPLAEALSTTIQEKLVEIGWSVMGEDSSPLSEYICLMLVNGKSQTQIAEELSGDLLGLSKEDDSATQFSGWLFEQLDKLGKIHGGVGSSAKEEEDKRIQGDPQESGGMDSDHDRDMTSGGESGEGMSGVEHDGAVPTGPKSMRGPPRTPRLFNQLSKAMERQPDPLRRVRPQEAGRVEKREPPKGPRGALQGPRGMQPQRGGPLNRMGQVGRGMGGPPMPVPNFGAMTPEQQAMAFYQLMEQQSQMLGGFIPPNMMMNMSPNGFMGPFPGGFGQPQPQPQPPRGSTRSLFDRVETPTIPNPPPQAAQHSGENGYAVDMEMEETSGEVGEGGGKSAEELFTQPCKWASSCTRAECPFAHPTPCAVGRTVPQSYIEKCPYAEKCKNRKCTGAHPSPILAAKPPIKTAVIEQDCKFFPNCKNPVCPFRHPETIMPLCRNGSNCTRPDCHFTHTGTQAPCKFNPCLNPNCIYTHTEGQQQGAFDHKVWTANGEKRQHVSERKFVNDEGEEELIIPGQALKQAGAGNEMEDQQQEPHPKPPGSAGSTTSSHTVHEDMDSSVVI